jgi:ribose transport system ATP-binding protein
MPSTVGTSTSAATPRLQMRGVCKAFPGVVALDGVDLEVRAGEVHVLLGENGAGKSTLINVLGGALRPDAGTIALNGETVAFASPREARARGIAIVHQELALVPALSVAENLLLGAPPARAGVIQPARLHAEASAALAVLDPSIDVRQPVSALRLGQQQLVEIARAMRGHPAVLVLDEPTSALTPHDVTRLFDGIRRLTASGTSVIYISHRMDEIAVIGDRITVLRDGRHVITVPVRPLQHEQLVRWMANRDDVAGDAAADRMPATAEASRVVHRDPRVTPSAGATPRLRVHALSRRGALEDITFAADAGEIVGFAGLLGAGRTELARALFGVDRLDAGEVFVDGQRVHCTHPGDAIRAGFGFVTEDRKGDGLLLMRSVRENIALPLLRSLARFGVVPRPSETTLAEDAVRDLRIRTPSVQQSVLALSGGNQQKVVLAKWLATGARILLLDEPTRGIDVAAKAEIHALIRSLAARGVTVLLFSSELPELLALADRTLVLRGGRLVGEVARADSSPERLLALAVGGVGAETHAGSAA